MKYEIVEVEEKIVEGLEVKTTNENGKSIQDIANMWQTFFMQGIYEKIENKVNGKTIGLYTDYEKDYTKPYNFVVCTEVSENSKNMENRVVKVKIRGYIVDKILVGGMRYKRKYNTKSKKIHDV